MPLPPASPRHRVGRSRAVGVLAGLAAVALLTAPASASLAPEDAPAHPIEHLEHVGHLEDGHAGHGANVVAPPESAPGDPVVAGGTGHDAHPTRLAGTEPDDAATTPAAGSDHSGHDDGADAAGAALPGTVNDAWSSASTFRTADGWYASPIHALLLTDGRVFFVGIARNSDPPESATRWRRVAWVFTPPPIGAPIPASTTIAEITEPVELDAAEIGTVWYVNDDLYCMGATLTHDGRVVTAGGTRTVIIHETGVEHTFGLPYETIFDGTSWVRQPGTMVGTGVFGQPTRWYPTLTRLPDARTLVSGGLEVIVGPDLIGFSNRTVETYDTDTGARALFSNLDQTPTAIQARDYTHVFVLPYATAPYDILELGEPATTAFARSTEPGVWITGAQRPGDGGESTNWGASSAMLPLRIPNGEWGYVNGAVLTASGDMDTPFQQKADIYDPLFGWRPTSIDLAAPRHHPSTVLLPDSRTLIVNGHDMAGGVAVQQAQYIDPATGFSIAAGTAQSGITRGYHSIALLLPDGRVLVGGGRDRDTKTSLEKPSYQIYSPDYLRRTRPVITAAPTALTYGGLFGIGETGPAPTEVMLMGLGSMTHSFDSNQRAIELQMAAVPSTTGGPTLVVAQAPADSHVAPPGHYLLVVLDANRTPSAARIVHIG